MHARLAREDILRFIFRRAQGLCLLSFRNGPCIGEAIVDGRWSNWRSCYESDLGLSTARRASYTEELSSYLFFRMQTVRDFVVSRSLAFLLAEACCWSAPFRAETSVNAKGRQQW